MMKTKLGHRNNKTEPEHRNKENRTRAQKQQKEGVGDHNYQSLFRHNDDNEV